PESWDDALNEMKLIQDFHQRGRGWNDIAYHFLIDGSGRVFEGRPQTVVGSHTLANNDGNIGIAVMGTFQGDAEGNAPNEKQKASLLELIRWLGGRYAVEAPLLRGHRDYKSTDCPGDHLYEKLPELRGALTSSQGAAAEVGPPRF